jgi:hypothetical protein
MPLEMNCNVVDTEAVVVTTGPPWMLASKQERNKHKRVAYHPTFRVRVTPT